MAQTPPYFDVPLHEVASFGPDYLAVVTSAVGMRFSLGRATHVVDIPGEPVAVLLYIVGYDDTNNGVQFPDGDTRVRVTISHGDGSGGWIERAHYNRVPVCVRVRGNSFGFVNKLNITKSVVKGPNKIVIGLPPGFPYASADNFNLDRPDGSVVVVVYRKDLDGQEPSPKLRIVSLMEGGDIGFYYTPPPRGPDSEVTAFTFPPFSEAPEGSVRSGKIHLFIGDCDRQFSPLIGRGDEIFLYSNTGKIGQWLHDTDGDGLRDIVNRTIPLTAWDRHTPEEHLALGRPSGNDPANVPGRLEAVRGAVSLEEDRLGLSSRLGGYGYGLEMDVFTADYRIPAPHEFAAFQIQSEDPENGDSFLLFAAANEIDVEQRPALKVTKLGEGGCVNPLCPTPYTLAVENAGDEPVVITGISDDKGLQFAYVGGDADGDQILDLTETWSYATSAVHAVPGEYTNTVTVWGRGVVSTREVSGVASATVSMLSSSLGLEKTVDKGEASPGETVVYTYTVTNTGQARLEDVVLTDDYPGIGYLTTIPSLASGASFTWTRQFQVPQIGDAGTSGEPCPDGQRDGLSRFVHNTAWARTAEGKCCQAEAQASACVKIKRGLAIRVVKVGEDVCAGCPTGYTLTVWNTGEEPVLVTGITDNTGLQFTYVGGDADGDQVLDLTETWSYTATTVHSVPGSYTNTVTVAGLGSVSQEPVTGTASATVRAWTAGLGLVKTVNRPAASAGETVEYTYTVTNTGEAELHEIVLTDDYPGIGYLTTIPVLASGASFTWTRQFQVPQIGAPGTSSEPCAGGQGDGISRYVHNTAWARTAERQCCQAEAQASACLEITPGPAIKAVKNGQDGCAGCPTGYTVMIRNIGNEPVGITGITDDTGLQFAYVGGDTNGDQILDMTEIWTYASTTIHSVPGSYTNKVTVEGLGTISHQPVTAAASAAVRAWTAGLGLAKTVDRPTARPGETVEYTYTVTNTGEAELHDIVLTDDYPGIGYLTTIPALASGATFTWTRQFQVPQIGAPGTSSEPCAGGQGDGVSRYVRNTARVFTAEDDCCRAEASATACLEIGGCTLTQGYWKTHSKYGPASHPDPTWALIGEDTIFFLSQYTYYQIMWVEPAGNPYYSLAHQFIAAELNTMNQASAPGSVLSILNEARDLFTTYSPAQVAEAGASILRARFVALAASLDAYNTGAVGPGHCDGIEPNIPQ